MGRRLAIVAACVLGFGCIWVGDPELRGIDVPVVIGPGAVLPESRAWTGEREDDDGIWAHTDPGDLPEVRDATGAPLPLRHTDVQAELRGHFAEVTVTQTFRNESPGTIEVVYAFPLPENAAVSRMRMTIGTRVVESEIMERGRARRTYETARVAGHTAALLEQERPNVFTHTLANVPPKQDIAVEIKYVQTLTYDAGEYEFVFPMVIGPRYSHGDDAARVSPPVVGKGRRRGDDFTIEVTARTGHPIDGWTVPTHAVEAVNDGDALQVELVEAETLPNRDFVLRYRAAGAKARATMFLGPKDPDGVGHFALVVYPPDLDVDAIVGRREFVFVIDRSGSMLGAPLAMAKDALRLALGHLRPVDTFEIVGFDSEAERLFGAQRAANAENLALALRFVDGLVSSGGTEMGSAIEAALGDDVAKGRHRYVLLLTDGWISFEAEIVRAAYDLVEAIAARGQHARVFGVGIGSAPNQHLMEAVSDAGRGAALRIADDASGAVLRFARWVDQPVAMGLRLDPGGLDVQHWHPNPMGDLFASHATVVLGEVRGEATGSPVVYASVTRKQVEIPVTIVSASERAEMLDALWARAAVADLELDWWLRPSAGVQRRITLLGLQHHIVTPFTSLIAVDRSRVVSDGAPRLVVEPTIVPEGADLEAAGGEEFTGGGARAEAMYRIQGASINNPSFGVVQDFVEGGTHWSPRARLVIGRVAPSKGVHAATIRSAIRAIRHRLRRCHERSSSFDRRAHHRLVLALAWTADGDIDVTLRNRDGAGLDTLVCMRSLLDDAQWPALPPGTKLEVKLALSAH